ncbi:hypothetical protein GOP47_0015050 [Adiantum capillus-veneris]|uniref:Uncharacterized protein n=1 Tax=Adiantum capillus-veneris TaxID=13818 RepID=A0A9D4UNI1_ADICA|nr:hypothetical protein GOP47_0015050 [Adiantum capillus-veneris]
MSVAVMEMEMEMVIFEALSMVEKRGDPCAEIHAAGLSSEVCMAMGMQKPKFSSPSSILDSLLDMALMRFMPRHMEVEMGEAFLATVDAKELEMMMVMLKPVNAHNDKGEEDFISIDMETEMVLQQHMDV